jgi:hypothetical protein
MVLEAPNCEASPMDAREHVITSKVEKKKYDGKLLCVLHSAQQFDARLDVLIYCVVVIMLSTLV